MAGEIDSWTEATDEAGDCLARNFDRSLCARYLWGIGFGIDIGHGNEDFGVLNIGVLAVDIKCSSMVRVGWRAASRGVGKGE